MTGANSVLFRESFAKWFRTKGFLMVLAVGLIPPALTGAWALTHDADLAVTALEWEPDGDLTAGDNVTFDATVRNVDDTTVDGFNVTIRVGFYQRGIGDTAQWNDVHNETLRVDGLEPGESTTVSTTWTSQGGVFQVEAFVDFFEEDIAEIEELNNYRPAQIQIAYEPLRADLQQPDTEPDNNTTDERADADLNLTALQLLPAEPSGGDNITFTVLVHNEGPEAVTNASLDFQVLRPGLGGSLTPIQTDTETFDLPAGETTMFTFEMDEAAQGVYGALAALDASGASRSDNASNNVLFQQFDVKRVLVWEEPPERATAKQFYRSEVLLPLHYTLLIPLIGLFFAGGVLHDERQRGNLVYLLTRPVPRWTLPLTRFATGFLVALVAVLVGVVLTWFLLLGNYDQTLGFLWWPLVFAVLVLLLYSAVFTFVGVVSDRPYLIGLLYVLGFETLVLAGSRILVNGRPLVQDWLLNFSLMHWVTQAFAGWDPSEGTRFLPQGDEAVTAFVVILGITVAALVGAVVAVNRRQFPE